MKLYNALVKRNEHGKIEDIIMIKEGFSCKVFIFNGLWFIYHRMWKEIFVFLMIFFAFSFASRLSSDFDKVWMSLILDFMVALNANHWLGDKLVKKGYEFSGIIFGNNSVNAKLRFVKKLQLKQFDKEQFGDAFLNPKEYQKRKKSRFKNS